MTSMPLSGSANTAAISGSSKRSEKRRAERAEFHAVYVEHFPALCKLGALLTGDAQEGQDLAQEAFARWYERRHSVTDPPAYLRTVVINQVKGDIRKAIVRRRTKPLLDVAAAAVIPITRVPLD
jgi:DNA-directed RNA polymerase specialized sigma24 family protein